MVTPGCWVRTRPQPEHTISSASSYLPPLGPSPSCSLCPPLPTSAPASPCTPWEPPWFWDTDDAHRPGAPRPLLQPHPELTCLQVSCQAPIAPPTAATATFARGCHRSQQPSPRVTQTPSLTPPIRTEETCRAHLQTPRPLPPVPGPRGPCPWPPPSLSRHSSEGVLCEEKSQPHRVPSRCPVSQSRPTLPALCPSRPPVCPALRLSLSRAPHGWAQSRSVPGPKRPAGKFPLAWRDPF